VLDANLHENILRSVALIAPSNPVHLLAASDRLAVERLHHVSVAGYVPYQSRPRPVEQIHHGVFSPAALRRSIGMLREAVGAAADGGRPRILIRRGARYRRLVNEAEIEAALSARGFTCVATDDLTLDAQVALFSKARMVVGVAGAALANLVFCRPDCPIVVMQPKFQNMASWYWHRMAVAAGAGPVVHVSGPQVEAHPDPWHDRAAHQDYRVELTDLLDAVDVAEALRG
jgi:capsular polysaccharide biosynthesis protein